MLLLGKAWVDFKQAGTPSAKMDVVKETANLRQSFSDVKIVEARSSVIYMNMLLEVEDYAQVLSICEEYLDREVPPRTDFADGCEVVWMYQRAKAYAGQCKLTEADIAFKETITFAERRESRIWKVRTRNAYIQMLMKIKNSPESDPQTSDFLQRCAIKGGLAFLLSGQLTLLKDNIKFLDARSIFAGDVTVANDIIELCRSFGDLTDPIASV
eukprot:GFYU01002758.1.p1 GENE.GFYU01002758.1~~GFYU01002758.1.p1  ORF type:complete len:213 (-),score=41.79 GFYU01002758.1:53-691(-)